MTWNAHFSQTASEWVNVDGVELPASFSELSEEVHAIRNRVAVSDRSFVCMLRIQGEDAYDFLDELCPCDMYLRDGEIRHTLLLSEEGRTLLELYLANDDDEYIWLSEGMPVADVLAHLQSYIKEDMDVELVDLNETHQLIAVYGPFAWELMAELEGPQIIGFPYSTFYHSEESELTLFRLGKTGEFGYDLLVPAGAAQALWDKLLEVGKVFDCVPVGFRALEHCAMENFFFDIRHEGREPVTPLELQLQWRVSYEKDYPGSAALKALREKGIARRVTLIESEASFYPEDLLFDEGTLVGEVIRSMYSHTLGTYIGLALIDVACAHSGLLFRLWSDTGFGEYCWSCSAPFVDNVSLFVNVQKHSYRDPEAVEASRVRASLERQRKVKERVRLLESIDG